MVAQLVEALRYKPQGGNKNHFLKKLKERLPILPVFLIRFKII
jgi:hypothetical protein